MKTRLSLLIGLVPLLLAGATIGGEVSVTDGDGLQIGDQRIRLFGIDPPELEQQCEQNGASYACGEELRAALSDLVVKGQIFCKTVDRDRYGRTVARCSATVRISAPPWSVRAGLSITRGTATGPTRVKSMKPTRAAAA